MDCPRCAHPAAPGDAFCEACGFDLRRTATPGGVVGEPVGEARRESGRRVAAVVFLVASATAVGLIVALFLMRGGATETEDVAVSGGQTAAPDRPVGSVPDATRPGEAPGEIFLEAAGTNGPDPFTGERFTRPVVPTTAPLVASTTSDVAVTAGPGQVVVTGRSGDEPGLYGGTRDAARCDAQGMLDFLAADTSKANAWAAAQDADPALVWGDGQTGLDVSQLAAFFEDLTPVTLLRDTRVTNHGFRDGRPTPRQSVLEAGTAVLVDRSGVPRARCACGNPLVAPQPAPTTPVYVGDPWEAFGVDDLVVVEPAPDLVDGFVLVDLDTGSEFTRPSGPAAAATGVLAEILVAEEFPVTQGIALEATYDSASFSVELDPAAYDWIAFSGAPSIQDVGTGDVERVTDGIPDLVFPNVDDYMVIVVGKDGATSDPIVIHDRDAYGTPIGNQAVIAGTHPSVWLVSRIDWSTDPVTSYTDTVVEIGVLTEFFAAHGPGTYTFDVEFVNKWTGAVAHGPVYLLAGVTP